MKQAYGFDPHLQDLNSNRGREIMLKRSMFVALVAVALSLIGASAAFGQEFTGNIVGTVRDSNGAAIAGATVTITDPTKRVAVRNLTTNEEGEFSAPNLLVAAYDITVEAPNFKKSVQKGVKVDVGQRRSVAVVLEAGRIEEIVTVQADAVAVETTSTQASTTINGDQVRELAINNRNFIQLMLLAPGVSHDEPDFVPTGTTNQETGTVNIQSISVNGARSSANTYTVDGADITDRGSNLTLQAYPSIDSIAEFRVLRSLFPAESGRSGGGQINVVTRGGARTIHGNLFEFVRNERFNANDYISNSSPGLASTLGRECDDGTISFSTAASDCKLRRRPFRYNNFGWTLGGPIYFLRTGERDPNDSVFAKIPNTYFFYSQEFRRDTRAPVFASTLPTAALKQGIFTVPVCLQATGSTCTTILPAGSPITSLRPINATAQQYVNLIYNNIPLPNSGVAGSFTANYPIGSNLKFQQDVIRIDHNHGAKTQIFYKFQNDKIPTLDGNAIFGSGSGIPDVSTLDTNSPGKAHTFQYTHVVSPKLIWQGRFTYGWGAIKTTDIGLIALARSPITPNLPYARTKDRVPSITGNGFTGLVGQGQYDNFSYKANFAGDVTWIRGSHSMKFGAIYSLYRKNENNLAGNNEGIFNAFLTPGATASIVPTGGNSTQQLWANFLLGTNVGFAQASFDYTADLRQRTIEAYAQDEWRLTRRITVNYGVRYSYFGAPYDKNGRLTNFVPELWQASQAPAVTGAGVRVPGTGNYCNGMIVNANPAPLLSPVPGCTPTASPWGKYVVDVNKTDFAPRVGIAYDVFGDGRTAIRAGYGMYHEQVLNGFYLSNIGINPPFQQTCTVASGATLDNPASLCAFVASNNPPSIRAVEPHFKTPYYQHWTADIQKQFGRNTAVTVGYYGSKGTHLIGGYEMNLLAPGSAIARGAQGCATGTTYFGGPGVTLGPCQVAGQAFFSSAAEAILQQIRPYRGYQSITMIQTRYGSKYHSLQVQGTHRFSGTSQAGVAYTWSKALSNNRTDRSNAPQNSYDIGSEWGRAALDRRHVLTVNYTYEAPWFKEQHGFVGKALGGWQVSGIATYQSGLPFTPTVSGYDPAGLGLLPPPLTVARPNMTCDPNVGGARTRLQWFNTACFQLTPTLTTGVYANTVGNGGIGTVDGPPTTRFDLTLSKNIRWGGEHRKYRLQLRAEAFNILNHTNFRGLNAAVWTPSTAPVAFGGTCTSGCSVFGSVSSVRDPRNMQLGAKFYF